MDDHTDPAKSGPGVWHVLHTEAIEAKTEDEAQKYIVYATRIIENFPCKTCTEHSKKYMMDNPMSTYIKQKINGQPLGMFYWTWSFHNNVNSRLRKSIMDFDTACNLYKKKNSCSNVCMGSK